MALNNKNILAFALITLVFLKTENLHANTQPIKRQHYVIEFYDKIASPYSTDRPTEFLSPKAIERKKKMGVPINEDDFPVNPAYRNELATTKGVSILYCSKWFNSAVVELDNNLVKTEDILILPFVKSVKYIGSTPVSPQKDSTKNDGITITEANNKLLEMYFSANNSSLSDNSYKTVYGAGISQIQMLSGHKIHNYGYNGAGVLIAVLDAGFHNVNKIPAFDSLFKNNRIVAWKDFVDFDESVWEDDSHGTNVLSCMGSNLPGIFVGTAPNANYLLIRTENAHYESRLEELSWIIGAEYADSMGADIINSSLGYSVFDNKEFSFTYKMLDGRTTLITRAADKAFEKGMLVMNSAGNEGNSSWHYVGAPADAFNVVSSGGVDIHMQQSSFSSNGPTYDGRLKPNISALATSTIVVESSGKIAPANGTSFSNPVLSGMMACLLQAAPDKSLHEIINAVFMSGSHAAAPNTELGLGVPDFEMALAILGKHPDFSPKKDWVWDNEFKKSNSGLTIRLYSAKKQKVSFQLLKQDSKGKYKKVTTHKVKLKKGDFYSTPWLINYIQTNRPSLESGNYQLIIKSKGINHKRNFKIENNI